MRAGDTFFLKKEAADKHLWVVISDPESHPEVVLFASMTSYDVTKEDVCLIVPGEHPFVKNKTCIDYSHARHATAAQLDTLVASKQILPSTPVSQALLERIRMGAGTDREFSASFDHQASATISFSFLGLSPPKANKTVSFFVSFHRGATQSGILFLISIARATAYRIYHCGPSRTDPA
jgi:hypothetical protein